ILRGERGAVLIGQLLGVELDPEAMRGRSLEQASDLIGRECDRIAIGVDCRRELGLRNFRDQLVDDLADVMRAAVGLAWRKRVKREKGWRDAHRFAVAQLPGKLEQPDLALGIEA